MIPYCPGAPWVVSPPLDLKVYVNPHHVKHPVQLEIEMKGIHLCIHIKTFFFIGFFKFGQGHRGPMIPYCPGAP
ncbi:unnamed protein product, partial [Staurois parvus]